MSEAVLIIDDEENIINSLKRGLRPWLKERGLELVTASSAHDALNAVKDHPEKYAVIISDQKMPDINGSELVRIITKKYPDIIPIILSGHSDLSDVKDIVKAGVFAFITKPWNNEKLLFELDKALKLHRLKNENTLREKQLKEDLKLGEEFQKKILKVTLPPNTPFSFDISSLPAPHVQVTGDFYDIFSQGDDIMLLTGDVSGHGIKAAFITAILKTMIHTEYLTDPGHMPFMPGAFLHWLNNKMCLLLKSFPDTYICFTAVSVHIKKQTYTYANAGQPPHRYIHRNAVHTCQQNSMVLGVSPDIEYQETAVAWEKGSRACFFSDGITPSGNEFADYTEEDFSQILLESQSNREILERIRKKLDIKEFSDDITLITLGF